MEWADLRGRIERNYRDLKHSRKAIVRDLSALLELKAIGWRYADEEKKEKITFAINLNWPTQVTETSFYEALKELPKAKSGFPSIR